MRDHNINGNRIRNGFLSVILLTSQFNSFLDMANPPQTPFKKNKPELKFFGEHNHIPFVPHHLTPHFNSGAVGLNGPVMGAPYYNNYVPYPHPQMYANPMPPSHIASQSNFLPPQQFNHVNNSYPRYNTPQNHSLVITNSGSSSSGKSQLSCIGFKNKCD